MKKHLLILSCSILLFVSGSKLQAQNGTVGLGIKLGSLSGLTAKFFLSDANALDITVGRTYVNDYRGYEYDYGLAVSGTYQWRRKFAPQGLEWNYGIGGLVSNRYYSYRDKRREDGSRVGLGLLGTIGIEYFIPRSPIDLFIEAQPYLEVTPYLFKPEILVNAGIRFVF
jgi:hypothetical protein